MTKKLTYIPPETVPKEGISTLAMRALFTQVGAAVLDNDSVDSLQKHAALLANCAKMIRETVDFNHRLEERITKAKSTETRYDNQMMNSDEERERVAQDILTRFAARCDAKSPR